MINMAKIYLCVEGEEPYLVFVVKESKNKTHWGVITRIGDDVLWVEKDKILEPVED